LKIVFLILIFPAFCESQDTLYLSYGSHLSLGKSLLNHEFVLRYNNSRLLLKELELDNYIFKTPGIYEVMSNTIKKHKYFGKLPSDEHVYLPSKFYVKVDSIRMLFIESSLRFSASPRVQQSLDSTILSIDVELINFYGRPMRLRPLRVTAAGIGAEVKGQWMTDNLELSSGKHNLNYKLEGVFRFKGYMQFDFEDYLGIKIPIGWHEEVK